MITTWKPSRSALDLDGFGLSSSHCFMDISAKSVSALDSR